LAGIRVLAGSGVEFVCLPASLPRPGQGGRLRFASVGFNYIYFQGDLPPYRPPPPPEARPGCRKEELKGRACHQTSRPVGLFKGNVTKVCLVGLVLVVWRLKTFFF